ncbi:hypothetical protein CSC78_15710 [Pseudoxanthomonas japonensis]|uniref:Uncharacterized protein n=1 Tax=Pseudoxanthomonas japonensis TaxID=69284 RepID=A0ABQ6ZDR5_9GAMM|nr:hypothetical protein CSC78_15710 [Pseudoxanthomonas japonensis]
MAGSRELLDQGSLHCIHLRHRYTQAPEERAADLMPGHKRHLRKMDAAVVQSGDPQESFPQQSSRHIPIIGSVGTFCEWRQNGFYMTPENVRLVTLAKASGRESQTVVGQGDPVFRKD